MRMHFLTAGLLCVIAQGIASADTFMADTFSYADGELTINDGTGDDVSGGLWVPHSGETFDDNISVINGQAELLSSGSEDANRGAGTSMVAGDTWYYAADFIVNDARSDSTTESLNNDYFMHFMDDGFGFRGRTYIDDPNESSTTQYTVGLSASSGGQNVKWGADLDFGTQYTLVAEYDFDSGDVRLWIDPADISSTSVTDPTPNANSPMTAITALGLRQDFISPGIPNNQVLVDNVAIGNDFADVLASLGTDVDPNAPSVDIDGDGDVDGQDFLQIQREDPALIGDWQDAYPVLPPAVMAVPEPSTMALIGLVVALTPWARRQRG